MYLMINFELSHEILNTVLNSFNFIYGWYGV